ncbi:MAG: dihydrolipoyl dehydrogenase [Gemmataceae bacterium]|nr:dihydrolipoyl dehydrogenase [Gemmataceae bacterium]
MAQTHETQLAVLGAGPGGYAAAFLAADLGMNVTLIDLGPKPGGTCLNVGCIPSKALLHVARLIHDAKEAAQFGVKFGDAKIDINQVRAHVQGVVSTLSSNLGKLSDSRKITHLQGKGRFTGPNSIEVEGKGAVQFKHCIIATGSMPARPPAFNLNTPRIMDSTGALKLEEVPGKLLVVGGGYIGLELGFVYASLGSQVTVVEMTDGLLPGADRDLVIPLHNRLKGMFHKILLKTKVAKVEDLGRGIRATLEGPEVEDKEPIFDRVLVSVGRRPNTADMGLETAGIIVNAKGFIPVDGQRRTSVKHIFAVGDAAGDPMLAHKASYEGKVAVEAINGEPALYDVRAVPAVVFTDPEIAWCGLTETEAQAQGLEIKRVRFAWAGSGRAMTRKRTEGLTKLLVDPKTEQILGVGIVGVDAGEMIGEAMLAIEMGACARDLAMTMHAHPTLSETLMEAAESIYGHPTHAMGKKK